MIHLRGSNNENVGGLCRDIYLPSLYDKELLLKTTKKMGRPVKSKEEKLSKYICLKLKPEQYDDIIKRAKQFNVSPATYVRAYLFYNEPIEPIK